MTQLYPFMVALGEPPCCIDVTNTFFESHATTRRPKRSCSTVCEVKLSPSRNHCDAKVQAKKPLVGQKNQPAVELADLNQAILEVASLTYV